jgi:radical SAM-linked protein
MSTPHSAADPIAAEREGIDVKAADEKPVGSEEPRQRLRISYAKGEAVKFISHQDEFRAWERTLRRAGLPLLYKQGFNPQPHIQFASPLGVGFTGANETLDIVFSPPAALSEVQERIAAKLPPGLTLLGIEEVPLKTTSLQSLLIGADYSVLIFAEPQEIEVVELEARIRDFLAESEIWRERQRKGNPYRYNLRPLVFELGYEGYTLEREEHRIFLRVQQRDGATGRPDEVVNALGLADFARTLRRERLYFSDRAADQAIFAQYRVVTQKEIDGGPVLGKQVREEGSSERRVSGRTIGERAADEFV